MLSESNSLLSNSSNKEFDKRESNPMFSEKQAAYYINMSVGYLQSARVKDPTRGSKIGPPFLKIGKSVRYLKSDIDKWLQELSQKQCRKVK